MRQGFRICGLAIAYPAAQWLRMAMLDVQKTLSGHRLPPGLTFGVDLVSPTEEQALIAAIGEVDLQLFRFHGQPQKRRTASFGWRYDFESESLHPAEKLPAFLLALRERAAFFAGMAAGALEHALLTRYDPGASIIWHCDRPAFDQIIGISLGAPTVLRFRRRVAADLQYTALPLPPRSIYHMNGEVRHLWEHKIAKMAATRWAITFRSLAQAKFGEPCLPSQTPRLR